MTKPDLNGHTAIFSCLSPLTLLISFLAEICFTMECLAIPWTPMGVSYIQYMHITFLNSKRFYFQNISGLKGFTHKKLWTCIMEGKKKKVCIHKINHWSMTNKFNSPISSFPVKLVNTEILPLLFKVLTDGTHLHSQKLFPKKPSNKI